MTNRKIIVNGSEWAYVVGRWDVYAHEVGTTKKWSVSIGQLLNLDNDAVETGMYKKWLHVTPSHIAAWIATDCV